MTARQSVTVRAARLFQRLPLSWLRSMEAPFVHASTRNTADLQLVFVLALPRSGSTLMYQTLIHGLKPLYLSNLWNLLYALPWSGGRLSAHLCADHQSDFRSNHGFVGGVCGPAEGFRFWRYWCGCGLDEVRDNLMRNTVLASRIGYLRRTLSLLTTPDKPFVSGYLGHVLAVERLRGWFPEALFVRLHRDHLSNALSILRSRRRRSNGWFSVFPKECEEVKDSDEHTQAASQVYWLNRRLSALDGDERTIHLTYEDLSQNPRKEIQRVANFCNERGMRLELKQDLPLYFHYKIVHKEESQDAAALSKSLKDLEKKHGPLYAL